MSAGVPKPMPHLHRGLSELLASPASLTCEFQPFVHLTSGEAVGYEILSRVISTAPLLRGVDSPERLAEVAHATGQLLELDRLRRGIAIEALARHVDETHAWFALNVDPRGVDSGGSTPGFTRALLERHGIPSERIVIGLAATLEAQNGDRLASVVRHYIAQGFRVALDDVGSGHASLTTLVRARPDIIKLDEEMIRDVHRDPLRTNLLHALADFGRRSNVVVVAEGVETEDDLAVVVRAGIPLAQGGLLARPSLVPRPLPTSVRDLVRATAARIHRAELRNARRQTVGSLDIGHPTLPPSMSCEEFDALLREDPTRSAYAVIDADQRTVGLVTRESFFEKTSGPFGFAFHATKSVTAIMEPQPLRIDVATPVDAASRLATSRDHRCVNHPVVVESSGRYVGLLSVQSLLEVVTALEIRHATYASPLTGLPGNVVIDSEIRRALEMDGRESSAFVYVDIDNFKALNDAYGFAAGDDVLRLLAELLREVFEPLGDEVLVGHVGGDDFVVVAPETTVEPACARLGEEFDRRVRAHYAPADLARGGIEATDRRGNLHFFPIAALSMAVVTGQDLVNPELHDVARVAAELKRLAKLEAARDPRSRFVRNRRVAG